MQCLQYVFYSLISLQNIVICEGASKQFPDPKNSTELGRTVEIPGSATAVEPYKFSAMFGSICCFPSIILSKFSERGYM